MKIVKSLLWSFVSFLIISGLQNLTGFNLSFFNGWITISVFLTALKIYYNKEIPDLKLSIFFISMGITIFLMLIITLLFNLIDINKAALEIIEGFICGLCYNLISDKFSKNS